MLMSVVRRVGLRACALIYTTVEFAEPGMSNATIKQDQNLSRSITSMSTGASIGDIKENKVKAPAVEAAF